MCRKPYTPKEERLLEFAQFLVEQSIDSILLHLDAVLKTHVAILEMEKKLATSAPTECQAGELYFYLESLWSNICSIGPGNRPPIYKKTSENSLCLVMAEKCPR